MAEPFTVKVVPSSTVEAALTSTSANEPQTQFNTHAHSLAGITSVLPHLTHLPPDAVQPLELLSPWLDLICASQQIGIVHRITLPRYYCNDVVEAGNIWQLRGRLSTDTLEDVEASFPRQTVSGHSIDRLFDGSAYFARLDTCSLKDAVTLTKPAVTCGNSPVVDQEELVQRLITSQRGCSGIVGLMATGLDVNIFLFPWRGGSCSARSGVSRLLFTSR